MDIKKRLPHEVCYDAADEILRQRAEIERLRAAGKIEQIAWDKLIAERDRLRAALDFVKNDPRVPIWICVEVEKIVSEQLTNDKP